MKLNIKSGRRFKSEIVEYYTQILIVLLIFVTVFLIIVQKNAGKFIYSLDDSYIHLAFSQELSKFHFGINANEYSSPSSSIIWPAVLTIFTFFKLEYYIPLFLSFTCVIGTLIVFIRMTNLYFIDILSLLNKQRIQILFSIFTTLLSISLLNQVFSGMEHTLHIFCSVMIMWGLININDKETLPFWFYLLIILLPLIRYEGLALSLITIVIIFKNGFKWQAVITCLIIAILLLGYSWFLIYLKLPPLPLSILQKSTISAGKGVWEVILTNFLFNISDTKGFILFLFVILFVIRILINKKEKIKIDAVSISLMTSIIAHLIFGKTGRYIDYIWVTSILGAIYLFKEIILNKRTINFVGSTFLIIIIWCIVFYKSINDVRATVLSSNNIYEQQYQMQRFLTEYYKAPIAVNDLGFVSYDNDFYILDLVGLGSYEVLKERMNSDEINWMNELLKRNNIQLAIIYDSWFPKIPKNWIKVGELYLSNESISTSDNYISFYVFDKNAVEEVRKNLKKFMVNIPSQMKLKII